MNPELAARYQQLMRQISALGAAAGGSARRVSLIAVSKTQPVEAVAALYSLGHRDFGENYAQELCDKAEQLAHQGCEGIRWHFIGHLQRNKVKSLIPWLHAVHSVDSARLAEELGKQWAAAARPSRLSCFVEVNVDGESAKSGISPQEAPALAAHVAAQPALQLEGLMAVPASGGDTGAAFDRLRELEQRCRPHTAGKLSMGMSGDFELAIARGATHVRVGTALFGQRPS